MKKWIWIGSFLLLIVIVLCIHTYVQAMKPFNSAKDEAIVIAKKQADLKTVENFSLYNGKKSYYILEGKNDSKEDIIVWIEEEKHDVTTKLKKDGLTKQQAINILLSEQNPGKINTVRLGMYDGIPVWEIYSHKNKDTVNYHCIDFETGEVLLTIENY